MTIGMWHEIPVRDRLLDRQLMGVLLPFSRRRQTGGR
jgi:hypothetical protein